MSSYLILARQKRKQVAKVISYIKTIKKVFFNSNRVYIVASRIILTYLGKPLKSTFSTNNNIVFIFKMKKKKILVSC